MKIIKKQQGVTMISIAMGLVLLAFFVTIAVTIWPVYMENFSVNSHLSRMAEDSKAKSMTKAEILKTLQKRFGVDDVKSVMPEDIIINGEPGQGYEIEVDYEVRKNLMGNVDIVISFNKVVEVK
jgi:hypothetical protein